MPSLNPPSTVSKFEHVICGVFHDTQYMGDRSNLIAREELITSPQPLSGAKTNMIDFTVAEHPFSISVCLTRGQ